MSDLTIGELYDSLPPLGWVEYRGMRFTRLLEEGEDISDLCPQGCGRMTEDPYGGPCKRCWEEV